MYVKHCPVSCPERQKRVEQHLMSRGVRDLTWMTDFPKDHPFVIWLQQKLNIKSGLAFTSGLVKTLESFRHLVRSDKKAAFFVDDDVVLVKDWNKAPIPDFPFVNMSVGVNFSMLPDGKPRIIGNNGGCEMVYVTREFAQLVLDNVDARQTIDIVIHALVMHSKFPLVCVPVAQQTSIIEPKSSSLGSSSNLQNWIEYIRNFKPTGVRYEDLRNESGFFARDDA